MEKLSLRLPLVADKAVVADDSLPKVCEQHNNSYYQRGV